MSPPRRILIVEDNSLVSKFYRLALERAGGFQCLASEALPEILAAVRAGTVDLAIIDVSLTNTVQEGRILDGVELTQLVKKESPHTLPVLLATAHAMAGDRERLLASSGADGYLEKPVYEAELLVQKVNELLRKAQQ